MPELYIVIVLLLLICLSRIVIVMLFGLPIVTIFVTCFFNYKYLTADIKVFL